MGGEVSARRKLLGAALVAAALVGQVTLVARLPLPGGVTPDLVLLVVVAFALTNGPLPGSVTGFAAGLAADLAPPADHTIGRYALVLCLVGYLCGLVQDDLKDSANLAFLAMVVGVTGGSLLYVGVGAVLGDLRVTWPAVTRVLPLSLLYDFVLSPFVLYVVTWLVRRVDQHRVGYDFWEPGNRYRR
ncbi:MAG: rod shape-determining protein MreD [Streptosporangiales bacterium]|nr:rod shape-determining protein MreD [Streptosporangiales bacterium]